MDHYLVIYKWSDQSCVSRRHRTICFGCSSNDNKLQPVDFSSTYPSSYTILHGFADCFAACSMDWAQHFCQIGFEAGASHRRRRSRHFPTCVAWASGLRILYRNLKGIWFQTTCKCCLNPLRQSCSLFFSCADLLRSTEKQSNYCMTKMDFKLQSEQDLTLNK